MDLSRPQPIKNHHNPNNLVMESRRGEREKEGRRGRDKDKKGEGEGER
jgi:hypothetical protein